MLQGFHKQLNVYKMTERLSVNHIRLKNSNWIFQNRYWDGKKRNLFYTGSKLCLSGWTWNTYL